MRFLEVNVCFDHNVVETEVRFFYNYDKWSKNRKLRCLDTIVKSLNLHSQLISWTILAILSYTGKSTCYIDTHPKEGVKFDSHVILQTAASRLETGPVAPFTNMV